MTRRRVISRAIVLHALLVAGLFVAWAPAQSQTPVVRFEVVRFVVEGDNPLSDAQTRSVLEPFTGEHSGVDGLLAAADALERAIQDSGLAFQRVVLPPQSLQNGTVTLRVSVFRVSSVEVRGARYHSEANVRRSVPALRLGAIPETGAIARNLAVANQSGWKTANLTFRESETDVSGLDAVLDVEDRRTWMVWSSVDNTGSSPTGPTRWSLGGSAGNLFDRDHTLHASYVTSPGHASQVRQWALGYAAPVYVLGGMVSAYHVRSDVETGRVLDLFDVSGAGRFAGVLYAHELERLGRLAHRISVGVDDRRFDNDVLFAGSDVDVAPPAVRSRPVSIGYGAEYAAGDWGLDVRVQYTRNLESGDGNDDESYGLNRAGARAGWDAIRGGMTLTRSLPAGWSIRGLFEGQFADEALIAGEQFGLGGVDSVRGFSEREIAGDDGFRGSVELWSPPLAATGLRFLLFADAGRVSGAPGGAGPSEDTISSIGAGVRWGWNERVSLLLDVGVVANGAETREHGAHGHLKLLVQY